ncbi:MAG: hypothetical protein IKX67_07150 [Bacteroidales bacterium]|nr:hypothetical protein [Bacteroidales bacterium]
MAWSKCKTEIGIATGSFSMPASLSSVGKIKDKSAVLEALDGDELSAKATGGEEVGHEDLEGGMRLTVRVIEPTNELYETLGLGEVVNTTDFNVKTHVPVQNFGVKVTPKNVGAMGITCPLSSVKCKPGWSDSEGNFLDLIFNFIKIDEDSNWYTRFKKPAPAANSGGSGVA